MFLKWSRVIDNLHSCLANVDQIARCYLAHEQRMLIALPRKQDNIEIPSNI